MEYDPDTVAELLEGNHDDVNANRLENMIAIFEELGIERDYDALTDRNTASLVRAADLEDISRAVTGAAERTEDDDSDDAEAEESDSPEESESEDTDEADNEAEEETAENGDSSGEEADSEDAQSADANNGFPREVMRERLEERTAEYDGGYDPDEHEEKDLYTLAQEYDVSGRSNMNKQELVEGILDAKEQQFEEENGDNGEAAA